MYYFSPARKSIKDRLGPVGERSKSPSVRKGRDDPKRDTVRDRLGRKEDSREPKSDREGKLKELPSELKAWASKTSLKKDLGRNTRSRSRDRPGTRRRSRSQSKERRRSRSRDRRRKRSLSPDKRKLSNSDRSPVKRRRNQRVANNKDKSFNSDSD